MRALTLTPCTMILLLLVLTLIALGLWVRRPNSRSGAPVDSADRSPDEQTLAALAGAGADLSKPTEVNAYLYFPAEGHARSAAQMLGRDGYATEVRAPIAGYTTWLCLATRSMVPRPGDIAAMTRRMTEVAREFGGEYDGWEAAVTS